MSLTLQQRRLLRIAVYAMLLLSAVVVLFFGERLWAAAGHGDLPLWAPLIAPGTFTIFVLGYTVDRWFQVRRHHYPAVRAALQVGFAVACVGLLWPQQATELRTARQQRPPANEVSLKRLLRHPNPAVRAAACELVGWRGPNGLLTTAANMSQEDNNATVREHCAAAVAKRRGFETAPQLTPRPSNPAPQLTP